MTVAEHNENMPSLCPYGFSHARSHRAKAAIGRASFGSGSRSGNSSLRNAREAVKALLIANEILEREMEDWVSRGYVRGVKHGRFNTYNG